VTGFLVSGRFIRVVQATVADCESNQAAWNAAIAIAGGGEVWEDAGCGGRGSLTMVMRTSAQTAQGRVFVLQVH
jgi:hypothetical protein